MRGYKIEIAPERIAEGKQLYELTETPVPDIATLMGISRRTLARRIVEWGWTPRSAPRHVTDRALVAAAPAGGPVNTMPDATASASLVSPEQRIVLAARIQSAVERGLGAVERVLDQLHPSNQGEAERSSRTLAAVARTLHELAAFTQPHEGAPPDETDDDAIPLDIDEFRDALARRIEAFIDARQHGEDGTADDIVDGAATEGT